MTMSFSENKTVKLWQQFMPRRKEIQNRIGKELYSLQEYGPGYFDNFDPNKEFKKWAAVEVTDFERVPDEMETITLAGGLYAVFLHQGAASTGPRTFQYIFGTWLPGSGYVPDNRLHFEILGEKYRNDDPESEEEIWIPIRDRRPAAGIW